MGILTELAQPTALPETARDVSSSRTRVTRPTSHVAPEVLRRAPDVLARCLPAPPDDLHPRAEDVLLIAGHRIPLHAALHPTPPADADWWKLWLARSAGCVHRYVQQAGARPTFVALAASDPALGRTFLTELICGGWFWPRLARAHHGFVLRGGKLEVFAGPRMRPEPALAQQALRLVLPAARAALAQEQQEQSRRATALAAALALPWFRHRLAARETPSALAFRVNRGECLVVGGALEQPEAEALADELIERGLWKPEAHGTTLVWRGRDGVEAETAGPGSAALLLAHARGFCEWTVVSDLHLGLPHRDTFGTAKARAFAALLDRVIARRGVLVLNGDFLELLHERYGAIKRAYPAIFARLAQVRRIVYVAGNHDADILGDRIKQSRRSVRAVALRHIYAEVRAGLDGELWLEPRAAAHRVRCARSWARLLGAPEVRHALWDLLQHHRGRVFLSHGFAEAGVAFHRLGPRDTPAEQPHWILDESLARRRPQPERLLKLLADRRQRLDRVLRADWGGHVEIVRYLWNPARAVYFEHGHAAIPACHAGGVGRLVTLCAGWLKRSGLRHIEHWFEEDLGNLVRAVYPLGKIREQRQLLERLLAVATWLRAQQPAAQAPWLVTGHTHDPAHAGCGPVHTLLERVLGARHANTGAWSSRFRKRRPGADQGEWLVLGADNSLTAHSTGEAFA